MDEDALKKAVAQIYGTPWELPEGPFTAVEEHGVVYIHGPDGKFVAAMSKSQYEAIRELGGR